MTGSTFGGLPSTGSATTHVTLSGAPADRAWLDQLVADLL